MKKEYVIEAIGTFFLVTVVLFSGNPIAIGAILIAMVYMGGYISGAHYNPAVTLAVYLRGKISRDTLGKYILSQVAGGIVAGFIHYLVTGITVVPKPSGDISFISVILVEALFTFALASVVLHATTSKATAGNEYYALAIGLTVMATAFTIGPVSGGVINPAVAIGAMAVDIPNFAGNFVNLALYIIGAALGGAAAASVYNTVFKDGEHTRPSTK